MRADFHAILGVPHNASQAEIHIAYLELAKTCHPDLNPSDPEASKRFKLIQRAFERLHEPEKSDLDPVKVDSTRVFAELGSRARHRWPTGLPTLIFIGIGVCILSFCIISFEMNSRMTQANARISYWEGRSDESYDSTGRDAKQDARDARDALSAEWTVFACLHVAAISLLGYWCAIGLREKRDGS